MSLESEKKRRLLREAQRRIEAEMPYRIKQALSLGGPAYRNSLIVPDPEDVVRRYTKTGKWKF